MWMVATTLRPLSTAADRARRFCERRLRARFGAALDPELRRAVLSLVDEMVGNAYATGARRIELRMLHEQQVLRVAVSDDTAARKAEPRDSAAPGLRRVQTLSDHWGIDQLPNKTWVWAELTWLAAAVGDA